MQVIELADVTIKPRTCSAMVTEPMAQMYRVIPIEFDGDTLTVAMCDPQNLSDSGRAANVSGLQHPRRGDDRVAMISGARALLRRQAPIASRAIVTATWKTTRTWPQPRPASARMGRSISTTSRPWPIAPRSASC